MKWIVCTVLAIGLFGQEKPAEPKELVHESYEAEIITVKTLSGDSFNRLSKLLSAFNVRYQADEKLRTIVAYGPKNVVAQMRKVVEQLDRPGSEAAMGKNIEGTMTFLRCSTKIATTASVLPTDMESVVRQLKAATYCKDVELWDSLPIHMQEGREARFDLTHPTNLPGTNAAFAQIFVGMSPEAIIPKDSGRYVRFSKLRINIRTPYSTSAPNQPTTSIQNMEVNLETAGDFKEGQKTVLGKLSGPESDTAIFAVITLKVLD